MKKIPTNNKNKTWNDDDVHWWLSCILTKTAAPILTKFGTHICPNLDTYTGYIGYFLSKKSVPSGETAVKTASRLRLYPRYSSQRTEFQEKVSYLLKLNKIEFPKCLWQKLLILMERIIPFGIAYQLWVTIMYIIRKKRLKVLGFHE